MCQHFTKKIQCIRLCFTLFPMKCSHIFFYTGFFFLEIIKESKEKKYLWEFCRNQTNPQRGHRNSVVWLKRSRQGAAEKGKLYTQVKLASTGTWSTAFQSQQNQIYIYIYFTISSIHSIFKSGWAQTAIINVPFMMTFQTVGTTTKSEWLIG